MHTIPCRQHGHHAWNPPKLLREMLRLLVDMHCELSRAISTVSHQQASDATCMARDAVDVYVSHMWLQKLQKAEQKNEQADSRTAARQLSVKIAQLFAA